ncbi:TRM11 family methyltransferase [Deinococcus sp. AJ005]|uniref:TRM11 family SAM-dependent methyltransferase n=1 Tax=Deinococcus sp. AJ005 TaxID=2652443 RepID=UPI00125CC9FD|nr:DNA methyltransferase [Deinococcus sp. AJ005]QFP77751.1 site-specific DNA-methyltransferase [Deinococcus sp. AJ005]
MINAIAVLRDNIVEDGDIQLALLEVSRITGSNAILFDKNNHQYQTIDGDILALVNTRPGKAFVSFAAESDKIKSLLEKSSFLQEIFLSDSIDYIYKTSLRIGFEEKEIYFTNLFLIEFFAFIHNKIEVSTIEEAFEILIQTYTDTKKRKFRNFKKSSLYLSHDLHVYKGKFFPRFVRSLINIYSNEGDIIIDPFCGSGTTMLEAALLNRICYGIDIDPMAVMISQYKLLPKLVKQVSPKSDIDFGNILGDELTNKILRKDVKNNTQYFSEITGDIELIYRNCNSIYDIILLSDALNKKIKYRYIGIGNGRYTVELQKRKMSERYFAKKKELELNSTVIHGLVNDQNTARFITLGDASDIKVWPSEKFDLIITSPPYLPASSGRETYYSTRAVIYNILDQNSCDTDREVEPLIRADLLRMNTSAEILAYLSSNKGGNPQKDAMRFERKYEPTITYLAMMINFLKNSAIRLKRDGRLVLVVAKQHIFYSSQTQKIEFVLDSEKLYTELAAYSGLELKESISIKLDKSQAGIDKPRGKDEYSEIVLVFAVSEIR